MKKKYLVLLIILAGFVVLSCPSVPEADTSQTQSPAPDPTSTTEAPGRPVIVGEVTQEKINDALEQIYDAHRTNLDLSGAQDYTVVRGDTLSQITRRYYGSLTDVGAAGTTNGFYFPLIMLASIESGIVDPDLIEIGMRLKVPDLKKNLANPAARQAIIECLRDVAYVYNRKGKPEEEAGLLRLANSL